MIGEYRDPAELPTTTRRTARTCTTGSGSSTTWCWESSCCGRCRRWWRTGWRPTRRRWGSATTRSWRPAGSPTRTSRKARGGPSGAGRAGDAQHPAQVRVCARQRFRRPVRRRGDVGGAAGGLRRPPGRCHVNQNFSQTIPVRFADPDRIIELLREWDLVQATGDLTGHMGTRVLADRAHPGQYVVIADFSGVCDMGVLRHTGCVRMSPDHRRRRRQNRVPVETQGWPRQVLCRGHSGTPTWDTRPDRDEPVAGSIRRLRVADRAPSEGGPTFAPGGV